MSSGPSGTPDPAMMALRVARAEPIAEDIHLFELRDPSGADLPEFSAGAHERYSGLPPGPKLLCSRTRR